MDSDSGSERNNDNDDISFDSSDKAIIHCMKLAERRKKERKNIIIPSEEYEKKKKKDEEVEVDLQRRPPSYLLPVQDDGIIKYNNNKILNANNIDETTTKLNANNKTWMETYQRLGAYKKQYNTTNLPNRYKEYPKVGNWVACQRAAYKKLLGGNVVNF